MKETPQNYHQQKMDFLDSLQPDDLRNGESFNQLETIIDNINKTFYTKTTTSKNSNIFLTKSLATLFRENSPAIDKAEELAQVYLQEKLGGNKIGRD